MDNVNNRSLFRRKSQAARDKVRQMGMVREPQGILASFPELMMAAGRGRPMMQQPQPMMQQPVQLQNGGDIALEAFQQGAPEPSLGAQIAANPALAAVQPVDITATPTPRERVEVPDIATMVRTNLGDNPEAQDKFSELEGALTDPETTDEQRKAAITSAAGVENTKDGLRSVVSQITGREQPASATVDELNRAITGVALGGAIGGPRSVAARISEALLVGLQAQRETAVGRERFEQEVRVAAAGRGRGGASMSPLEPYADAVRDLAGKLIAQGYDAAEAVAQAQTVLDPLYQNVASAPAEAPGGSAAGGELPIVTTQADYDALPSDTEFMQNGQRRKKP
jgi:hypothetical protein